MKIQWDVHPKEFRRINHRNVYMEGFSYTVTQNFPKETYIPSPSNVYISVAQSLEFGYTTHCNGMNVIKVLPKCLFKRIAIPLVLLPYLYFNIH